MGRVLAIALCFSAIKLSVLAAMGWQWGMGFLQWPARIAQALMAGSPIPRVVPIRHTIDATDLLTLPALLVSLPLGWRRCGLAEDGCIPEVLRP